MHAECQICCETYVGHRRRVQCPFCPQAACTTCVRAFLVSDLLDARCMGCRHAWSRDFLDSVLPRCFMLGEYKAHRERVLEQQELAQLPATQERLPPYREYLALDSVILRGKVAARALKTELGDARADLRAMQQNVRDFRATGASRSLIVAARAQATSLKASADRVGAALDHALLDLTYHVNRRRRLRANSFMPIEAGADEGPEAPAHRTRRFVRACPVSECRGFLSEAWKCGTCDAKVCSKCHEPKADDGHACDPTVAASAALIAADSKPCPSCSSLIFKIGGCDQMFCVSCNTAFSWRTGEIVQATNNIHNPHYYEWLFRTRGAQAAGAPAVAQCQNAFDGYFYYRDEELMGFHRVGRHIMHMELPALRRKLQGLEDNLELRLRYLTGDIDAHTWRVTLQRNEKAREKTRAVTDVYDMFVTAGSDVFRDFAGDYRKVGEAKEQLRQLVAYADTCLVRVAKRFAMRATLVSRMMAP